MTRLFQVNTVLFGAVCGTLAYASPPMHPGAGSAVMNVWSQSAAAQEQRQSTNKNDGAYGSIDSDWQPSEWVSNRFAEYPLYEENSSPGEESDVMRRTREVQEEANQRWYGRRIENDTTAGGDWYPEEAGWIAPDGKPDATKWPWWLF